MVAIAAVWTYWGIGEMYHEGWWGAWYNRLPYLAIPAACLLLTLAALRWPRVGGWLIILIGGAFTIFFMDLEIVDGRLTIGRDLGGFLVSGPLVLIGILFLVEAARSRRARLPEPTSTRWWRKNLKYLVAIGVPVAIGFAFSAVMLPVVLTRVDDGERGQRLIEGNGVTLVWAPEGPGWNWRQPWGGFPSWDRVALYGVEPVGMEEKPGYGRRDGERVHATAEVMRATQVCRYLGEDGLTLMDEPQDIWRMPTTEEVVRSLVRHGQNAGCEWGERQEAGERGRRAQCEIQPDKESPLWASDQPAIYYWTADEYDERYGFFVACNGTVNAALKSGGNPRHSYRCVRDP
jgi:hypothetical protein